MEKEEELQGPKRTNVNPRDFIDFSRPYMRGMMIFPLLDRRTTQQTGKGKIHGFYSLMVVGNGNGLVGVGEARDMESPINARNKALVDGVKNMDWVDRFEERTIWSEVQSKMGAVKVIMRPRPVGFGLHCNPYIHQILKAAGIKDVSAKVWGSRNPLNVIKTTIRMLQSGHPPLQMGAGATIFGGARRREGGISIRGKEAIERERGRKLVAGRAW
ncbi:ribosomal protein S5 domain 2-like protein [Auriculariales sp. MPI-PUGE-AT-0066]|nr:ribosomal protein S5 domain 2-like protein [Auriculariales sp. MPI-PUGE-AT-0066]